MRIVQYIVALSIAGIILACWTCSRSHAASRYPTVPELEYSLHLAPGGQLPRLAVVNGRPFGVFYVRGRELSPGAYSVILRLVPAR